MTEHNTITKEEAESPESVMIGRSDHLARSSINHLKSLILGDSTDNESLQHDTQASASDSAETLFVARADDVLQEPSPDYTSTEYFANFANCQRKQAAVSGRTRATKSQCLSRYKRHERRPSESFFDFTSSDEDEDNDVPVVGPAARLKTCRILNKAHESAAGDSCHATTAITENPRLYSPTEPLQATDLSELETGSDIIEAKTCSDDQFLHAYPQSSSVRTAASTYPSISQTKITQLAKICHLSAPSSPDERGADDRRIPRLSHGSLESLNVIYSLAIISLWLRLKLAGHPHLSTDADLDIAGMSSSVDGKVLFYRTLSACLIRLLGWSRAGFRFIPNLAWVSINQAGRNLDHEVYAIDPLQHSSDPRIGHVSNVWILRLHKQDKLAETTPSVCIRFAHEKSSLQISLDPNFSFNSSAGTKFITCPAELVEHGTSFVPVYLGDFMSLSMVHTHSHHRFSLCTIAFYFLCTVGLTTVTTVLWILSRRFPAAPMIVSTTRD